MSVAEESLANLTHRWTSETAPRGRKNVGLTTIEWMNQFNADGLLQDDLERISKDRKELPAKRAAAVRMIRYMEDGDIADFDEFLSRGVSLREIRTAGIDTRVVKKIKQKSRVVPIGDDMTEEIIEREIELHNRSGEEFDRVINHTEGQPVARQITQSTSVEVTIERKMLTDDDVRDALKLIGTADDIGVPSTDNGSTSVESVHPDA